MDPTAPNNPNSPGGPTDPPQPTGPAPGPPKPNITATALDPNDPLVGLNNPNNPEGDNTIQTGQFVVAGGDAAPQAPQPPPAPFAPAPAPDPLDTGQNPLGPTIQPPPVTQIAQAEPVAPQPPPVMQQPGVPSQPLQQPDPSPYVPPPASPGGQAVPSGGGSMIKKLRLFIIILGVLILLGAIAALVWFLILGKSPKEPTQSQNEQAPSGIEEPSPLPKRTEGGFGTLPLLEPASGSALQSTPSAQ